MVAFPRKARQADETRYRPPSCLSDVAAAITQS